MVGLCAYEGGVCTRNVGAFYPYGHQFCTYRACLCTHGGGRCRCRGVLCTEATFVRVEVPLVRASQLFAFLGEPTEDGNIESHRAVENGAAKLRSLGRGVVRHYQSLFSRTSPYLRDIVFCSFACLVGPTVSVWMATPRRIC